MENLYLFKVNAELLQLFKRFVDTLVEVKYAHEKLLMFFHRLLPLSEELVVSVDKLEVVRKIVENLSHFLHFLYFLGRKHYLLAVLELLIVLQVVVEHHHVLRTVILVFNLCKHLWKDDFVAVGTLLKNVLNDFALQGLNAVVCHVFEVFEILQNAIHENAFLPGLLEPSVVGGDIHAAGNVVINEVAVHFPEFAIQEQPLLVLFAVS